MHIYSRFLIFVIALFMSSCIGKFKEISINNINSFKLTKIDAKSIEGEINVSINNPNNTSFKVYKSKAVIFVGGSKLGEAHIVKKVKIAANSSIDNTFVLHGDFKELNLGTLANITMGKPVVEIKGYIKAGKWFYKKKFPVDQQQKLAGQNFKGLLPGF
ncbi:MAG TPA: LEA type 2 family protein [Bacteroidia bacterium]